MVILTLKFPGVWKYQEVSIGKVPLSSWGKERGFPDARSKWAATSSNQQHKASHGAHTHQERRSSLPGNAHKPQDSILYSPNTLIVGACSNFG